MKCILHGLLVKKRCSCRSKGWCERDESKELSLLEEECCSRREARAGLESGVATHIEFNATVPASFGELRQGQRVLNICGQATKGTWGMSWHQKAMTSVEDCDKPGVVVKQTLIPGFSN